MIRKFFTLVFRLAWFRTFVSWTLEDRPSQKQLLDNYSGILSSQFQHFLNVLVTPIY